MRRGAGMWLGAVMALASAQAEAQTPADAAQRLFEEGRTLMTQGRYQEACPKLEESERIEHGPGTLFHLSDCYEHTGRTASAWQGFLAIAEAAKATGHTEHEARARARAEALAPRLSKLAVVTKTARQVSLRLEHAGAVVAEPRAGEGLPLDPGEYTVIASGAEGTFRASVRITTPGETVTLEAPGPAPRPIAPPPVSTPPKFGAQRAIAIAVAGVGVVGIGVGSYFGVRSIQYRNEAKPRCMGDHCDGPGAELRVDAFHAGNASTIAFAAGAGVLAIGAALWFTAPRRTPPPKIALVARTGALAAAIEGVW